MNESYVTKMTFDQSRLREKSKTKRNLSYFDMELTARCNNDCRHCYVNLPAGDIDAKKDELTFDEIKNIVDEVVALEAMDCLLSGGEPLLREDFPDIYLYLKKKGIRVTIFTNATLINQDYIKLFKRYPPREIEVTVYGITKETYGRVTRRPGNFDAFMRGVKLFDESGLKVRYKAMAIRSNYHEIPEIREFSLKRTVGHYRFDPHLHLRYDGDPVRNEIIKSERLTPEEVVALEQSDPERSLAMIDDCKNLIMPELTDRIKGNNIFRCYPGTQTFSISHNGILRLCGPFCRPDLGYDLRKGSVTDAWLNFVPKISYMESDRPEFLENCRTCPIVNLCIWCPANTYLETGDVDAHVDFFCKLAHAREKGLKELVAKNS